MLVASMTEKFPSIALQQQDSQYSEAIHIGIGWCPMLSQLPIEPAINKALP
jgi:hypothetical protein